MKDRRGFAFLQLLRQPKIQKCFIWWVAISLVCFFAIEAALNLLIRSQLRAYLLGSPIPGIQLKASADWMTFGDMIMGRVRNVIINGRNCTLGGLRFARFTARSRGFRLRVGDLLVKHNLQFKSIEATSVTAELSAGALQDYINQQYPGRGIGVSFASGMIELSGNAYLLGKTLPVRLGGGLGLAGPHSLRFYPTRFTVAGRPLSAEFLKFVGTQIPLQFSIMENWPLQMTAVTLQPGRVKLIFREMALKEGSG